MQSLPKLQDKIFSRLLKLNALPTITEVPLSRLQDRIDANYHATRLSIEDLLKKGNFDFISMGELCSFPKAKTPKRTEYIRSGTPALKLKNITDFFLNWDDVEHIPKRLYKKFFQPKIGDILITATGEGTIGRVNLFEEPIECIVTGEIIVARVKEDKVNSYYLLGYLKTRYGKPQLIRFARGATGQTHLYSKDVRKIQVPLPSAELSNRVEQILKDASNKDNLASKKYELLKLRLYSEIGFHVNYQDFNLDRSYEVKFSEIDNGLRYDPEFHQPKYSVISEWINSKKTHSLQDIAELISGSYIDDYVGKGTLYLRVKNINELELDLSDTEFVNVVRSHISDKIRVKENDVLFTRTGSTGVAFVASKNIEGAVVSQHLTRIILKEGYYPFYVALFLNSVIGRLQSERPLAGSLQKELTHDGTRSIRIPVLPEQIQRELGNELVEVYNLRKESKDLMKKAVLEIENFLDEIDSP